MSLFDDISDSGETKTPVPAAPPRIGKVSYTHDAVIDMIIADPTLSQGELSRIFGYSQTWMSIIINSDAFKQKLAERKAEIVNPQLRASVEERLNAVAQRSLDKLIERLDRPGDAIKTPDLVAIARLGVGDRNLVNKNPNVQNNLYVVNLPPPAPDAKTWRATAQGRQDIEDARVYD